MTDCEALHVNFIDDSVFPGRLKRPIVPPVELSIRDDRARYVRSRVEVVSQFERIEILTECSLAPVDLSVNTSRVWVKQEFRWIAAKTVGRGPRPVYTKPVFLSGVQAGKITVPAPSGHLRQRIACLAAGLIK